MSETKKFAGREFQRIEIDGVDAVCWSHPTEWPEHPILVCEKSDEMWMLYDARTESQVTAIDLLGVEIVLRDWFSLERRAKVRALVAQAMGQATT